MGCAGFCLPASPPSTPSASWNKLLLHMHKWRSWMDLKFKLLWINLHEKSCLSMIWVTRMPSREPFLFLRSFYWKREKHLKARPEADNEVSDCTRARSGLQKSRQWPSHRARVAGKHRALKPEQDTSSQQFDFFFCPITQGNIWEQRNSPRSNTSPTLSTICQLLCNLLTLLVTCSQLHMWWNVSGSHKTPVMG